MSNSNRNSITSFSASAIYKKTTNELHALASIALKNLEKSGYAGFYSMQRGELKKSITTLDRFYIMRVLNSVRHHEPALKNLF